MTHKRKRREEHVQGLVQRPIEFPDFRHFTQHVEVLESAHELLRDGRVSRSRLALIALDHLAEVAMHHCCKGILTRDAMLGEIMVPTFSPLERRALDRYFHKKVELLEQEGRLSRDIAVVLTTAHRYRNPAHHRDRYNDNTIAVIAGVLFDAVVRLLREAYRGVSVGGIRKDSEASNWLTARGLSGDRVEFADAMRIIGNRVLDETGINALEAQKTLAEDVRTRGRSIEQQVQNIGYGGNDAAFSVLLHIEEFAMSYDVEEAGVEYRRLARMVTSGGEDKVEPAKLRQAKENYERRVKEDLENFRGRLTPDRLRQLVEQSEEIEKAESHGDMLGVYERLDRELEEYEEAVLHAAWRFEAEVQAEIDRRRGK